MQKIPKWKTAVMIWLGIYPTITTYFYLMSPIIAPLPVPLKTMTLTLLVVPTMVWIVLPFLQKVLKDWLNKE